VWQNKYPPKIYAVLSSHLGFQSEILSTYIYSSYAHIMYFKVIRITVTSPSDFSVLENFHREMHSWISRAEHDVNQLSGFHCQKWLNMPANFILKFQATDDKTAKKILGGFFLSAPACYTNSSLALAGIITYISLRFTQSNNPTHTKSLFSFRNTRISRISRQSVSASSCKTPHTEKTRST